MNSELIKELHKLEGDLRGESRHSAADVVKFGAERIQALEARNDDLEDIVGKMQEGFRILMLHKSRRKPSPTI